MGNALRDLKQGLMDRVIRMRARSTLCATPFDRYRVSVARSVEDHREAFRLVHIAYAWLGIEPVAGPDMRMTPQHVLPESTIFIVRDEEDRLVGTMTVTLDSAAGLPLDHNYARELTTLRQGERRCVEYGSLAVVQRCKHSGVSTLLTMAANWFSLNYLHATDVVMGVHPKAAPLYRAIFKFAPLGAVRDHAELEAPVQGMVQDLTTIEGWFRRNHRAKSTAGLPLYHHFFDELPSCIELPPVRELRSLARWKLPRAVFRRIFIDGSDRLQTLDARTRSQLQRWRSPMTTDDVPLQGWKEAIAQ
ncbi:MAG: hypothetical protein JRH20_14125 [Deltaproteobacteria bacterium]|nr:hypothetical protein [Deltaproteobacteria bacterium]